jgi:TolB protein
MSRILTPSFLALLFLAPAAAHAQERVIDIFRPEKVVHPIALPLFEGQAAGLAANVLPDAIGKDLEFTGVFKAVDRNAFLEKPGAVKSDGTGTKWEDWTVLKASLLVRGAYKLEGGKLAAKVWVFNVADGAKLGELSASETPDRAWVLSHKLADGIYEIATGEKGIFSSRLAFISNRSGHKEVTIAHFDGSKEQPITKNRSINLSPSWSPDGGKISFTSYVRNHPDLYLYDRAADKFFRISDRAGINIGGVWSPQGRVMAATLSSEGGNPDIFLMGEDGKGAKRLTEHYASDVSPTWSPDAKQIAFVSDRGGAPNVYVMKVDGSDPKRVTFDSNGTGKDNQAPVWSPRGDRIAFQSRIGGAWQILTMKPDGTEVRPLTAQGNNEDPAWSPDGRLLGFVHDGKLWVMEADGTNARQIAGGTGQYSNIAWSPRLAW